MIIMILGFIKHNKKEVTIKLFIHLPGTNLNSKYQTQIKKALQLLIAVPLRSALR